MRIEFDQLDYAFKTLMFHNQSNEEPDVEICRISFAFPWVELYRPLNSGFLKFTRTNQTYSSKFSLTSDTSSVFTGISEELGRKVQRWSPTNKHGCGYVLDESGEPVIGITDNNNKTRIVSIGAHGAQKRVLSNYEDFSHWMHKLETTANILVNACLEKLLASSEINSIPEHSIYVTS